MKRKLINFITLLMLVSAITAFSQPTGVAELDHYKTIYEQEVSRLMAKTQMQRLHIPQEHIKALQKLENEYQQAGDLRNLLIVRKERERFISDPRVNKIIPVSTPIKLRNLQVAYIHNYKAIKQARKKATEDIRSKYMAALKRLQTKLTKQGKIDDALIVMKELDALQSGTDNGITIEKTDFSNFTSTNDNTFRAPTTHKAGDLDAKTIAKLLNGEVNRWNSYNHEITIKYDFSNRDQAQDWKGGKIRGVRGRITCNRTIAWLKLQFSDIKRIEVDMLPSSTEKRAGFVVGRDLTAMITKDRTLDGKIYQSSEQSPIVTIANIKQVYAQPYTSIVTINKQQISWNINGGRTRHGVLKQPIEYPTFIGLGCMTVESSYASVTVTGVLSTKMINRLKAKLTDEPTDL